MPSGILPRDANFVTAIGGTSSATDTGASIRPFQYDPDTRGMFVQIVGDDVGIGGGTQYTEDVAAPADPVGNALMITRDDQLATVTEAEGDWSRARGTSKGALWVAIADSSGDPITSFGGGTQYTEDAAAAANPVGNAQILVRTDTPATQVTTDGDNVAQRGTNYGAAYVQLVTSAGAYIDSVGGGTEYTEDVATANPQVGKAIMMERDDALTTVTPIEGDWIGLRGTAEGALWTQDFNSDAILADTAALVVDAAASEVLLGTIDADTGGILTAVQLIDNAVSGAGFNITQFNGAAVPIGAGLEATALRVTVATDSTGVLSVDDNGGILTVDGTVTANLSATDNAVLDAIEVDTTTIAGAVSGTEMQVDVVAALPAGTNAIGKLAANSGVDIGDVDVTSMPGTGVEDAGETAGGTLLMAGSVRRDTPAASAGTTGDNATVNTDNLGRLYTHPSPTELDLATLATTHVKKYYTNAGAVTDGIIWSPGAGKRWFVTDIFINVSAAATVTLEDDLAAGDSAIWKAELAANSGWSHSFETPWFSGEDAADLIITTSAGNVYVTVTGYEI